jgi:coproporphyrinogen III oxidase-like Fe-S oxidoreductase
VEKGLLPAEKISDLVSHGLMAEHNGRWRLTRRGKLVADEIAEAFI